MAAQAFCQKLSLNCLVISQSWQSVSFTSNLYPRFTTPLLLCSWLRRCINSPVASGFLVPSLTSVEPSVHLSNNILGQSADITALLKCQDFLLHKPSMSPIFSDAFIYTEPFSSLPLDSHWTPASLRSTELVLRVFLLCLFCAWTTSLFTLVCSCCSDLSSRVISSPWPPQKWELAAGLLLFALCTDLFWH